MKQPAWVREVFNKQQKKIQDLETNAPVYDIPIHTRTPGWIFIKEELSCIPDPLYPWNPKIVKAIREIDSNLVPLWSKRIFRTPYSDSRNEHIVFGRHGLGMRTKSSFVIPFDCPIPSGYQFPKPNNIYRIFEGEDSKVARDLPGEYIPFDWRIYKYVKNNYRELTREQLLAMTKGKFEAGHKQTQKNSLEFGKMNQTIQDYTAKKLWDVSEVEMKNHFLGLANKK